MICIENIGFLGVLQKIYSFNFTENEIDDFISFTKPWSRAPQARFFKLLKKKLERYCNFFPKILRFHAYFLMFCIVFTGNRWKMEKLHLYWSRAFNSL